MRIDTPDQLRDHIELAIRVELSTIPPYLYAMYSIEDQESDSALLIRSIVAEEMLHAALATNLLLAVGGTPRFGGRAYVPEYPMDLPHHRPPLRLELSHCTMDTIESVFMRIEQPEVHEEPLEGEGFATLGQFYHALENGLERLAATSDIFAAPNLEAQMSDAGYYKPVAFDVEDSGGLLPVTDIVTAVDAIDIIVHQGEGLSEHRWADPSHQELTHYHKLVRIRDGISPLGTVRPLRRNPSTESYPEDLKPISDLFNALYRSVYLALDRLFGGDGGQDKSIGFLYLVMGDLMSQTAHYLAAQELDDGTHAGPTFEFYEFSSDDVVSEIADLAELVSRGHRELSTVRDAIEGLRLLL